jgi:hypothetical protein
MKSSVLRNAVYTTVRTSFKGVVADVQIPRADATPEIITRARTVSEAALVELMKEGK